MKECSTPDITAVLRKNWPENILYILFEIEFLISKRELFEDQWKKAIELITSYTKTYEFDVAVTSWFVVEISRVRKNNMLALLIPILGLCLRRKSF